MTKKRDPELVKAKREVIKFNSEAEVLSDRLALYTGYLYEPENWDRISEEFDENTQQVHEVTLMRHETASNIAKFKAEKRALGQLIKEGIATRSQIMAFGAAKSGVSTQISVMSELPELGSTFAEWETIDDEFKQKSAGHPKTTLQEKYITAINELKKSLARVHKEERNQGVDEDSLSTIEDILKEADGLETKAGRKQLDGPVKDIERLETQKRTIMTQIEDIKAESDTPEVKTGKGRRKRSKADRLAIKLGQLETVKQDISNLVESLSGLDYAERYKRVLEREHRYAKEEGRNRDLTKIKNRLKKLKELIEDIPAKGITNDVAKSKVNKLLTNISITVEESMGDLVMDLRQAVDNVNAIKADIEDSDDDILSAFENMELPTF